MPKLFTQMTNWRRRQRSKSNRTVTSGLHQTHGFLESANPISTSDSFPSQTRDITVEAEVTVTNAVIAGTVFELGGGTGGLTLTIDDGTASIFAGETGDDGVSAVATNFPNQTKVNGATIVDDGTVETYVVDDILTVVGGTFTVAATLRVTSVSSGAITGIAVENPGFYTVQPSDPVSHTGGSGSGATFNLTYEGSRVKLVAAVRPGTGEAWLWINGKIAARGTSVNGELPNGWGTSEDGAVGDVDGTVHPDVPGAEAVTLAGGTVNGLVRVYHGYLPKNLSS